jgi:hypothetical protein
MSTSMPRGNVKTASGPIPSLVPELPAPAMVVTTPRGLFQLFPD